MLNDTAIVRFFYDGSIYSFGVYVTVRIYETNETLEGYSSVSFFTNSPPTGGYCYLSNYPNANSTELITIYSNTIQKQITVICEDWTDYSVDLPLKYNVLQVYKPQDAQCYYNGRGYHYGYWYRYGPKHHHWGTKGCRGTFLAEFERTSQITFYLGSGQSYLLIAYIKDRMDYSATYQLPRITIEYDPHFPSTTTTAPPTLVTTTANPTTSPSPQPTDDPTKSPTFSPITDPTHSPSYSPSYNPSYNPTYGPTNNPSPAAPETPTQYLNTPEPPETPTQYANTPSLNNIEDQIMATIELIFELIGSFNKTGDTQMYFQLIMACNNVLNHYIEGYYGQLGSYTLRRILQTKLVLIFLTEDVIETVTNSYTSDDDGDDNDGGDDGDDNDDDDDDGDSSDTSRRLLQSNNDTTSSSGGSLYRYEALKYQIDVISSFLGLFCDEGSNSSNSSLSLYDLVETSDLLSVLGEYFDESSSLSILELINNVLENILSLDEFHDELLDAEFSDTLLDIASSIHIWYMISATSGETSSDSDVKYSIASQLAQLIHLISQTSLTSEFNVYSEATEWSSCWLSARVTLVLLSEDVTCNGVGTDITWPDGIAENIQENLELSEFYDELYDAYINIASVDCVVTEITYDASGNRTNSSDSSDEDSDDTDDDIFSGTETVIEIVMFAQEIETNGTNFTVDPSNLTLNVQDLDVCNGIEFTVTWDTPIELNSIDNIEGVLSQYNIPHCQWSQTMNFSNISTDSWGEGGCFIKNYTETSITCSCTHLTFFKTASSDWKPEITLIGASGYSQNITLEGVFVPLVTIGSLMVLFLFVLVIGEPRINKKKDTKPLLAIPDVISKSDKMQLMLHSGYAQALMVINDRSNEYRGRCKDKCSKIFKVFKIYMKDYHTIISIFTASDHTNYSVKQRIGCCFMYLVTIMFVNAVFYSQSEQTLTASIILLICNSLLTCVPAYAIVYMFQFSRPKERQSRFKALILHTGFFEQNSRYSASDFFNDDNGVDTDDLSLEWIVRYFITAIESKYKSKSIIYNHNPQNHNHHHHAVMFNDGSGNVASKISQFDPLKQASIRSVEFSENSRYSAVSPVVSPRMHQIPSTTNSAFMASASLRMVSEENIMRNNSSKDVIPPSFRFSDNKSNTINYGNQSVPNNFGNNSNSHNNLNKSRPSYLSVSKRLVNDISVTDEYSHTDNEQTDDEVDNGNEMTISNNNFQNVQYNMNPDEDDDDENGSENDDSLAPGLYKEANGNASGASITVHVNNRPLKLIQQHSNTITATASNYAYKGKKNRNDRTPPPPATPETTTPVADENENENNNGMPIGTPAFSNASQSLPTAAASVVMKKPPPFKHKHKQMRNSSAFGNGNGNGSGSGNGNGKVVPFRHADSVPRASIKEVRFADLMAHNVSLNPAMYSPSNRSQNNDFVEHGQAQSQGQPVPPPPPPPPSQGPPKRNLRKHKKRSETSPSPSPRSAKYAASIGTPKLASIIENKQAKSVSMGPADSSQFSFTMTPKSPSMKGRKVKPMRPLPPSRPLPKHKPMPRREKNIVETSWKVIAHEQMRKELLKSEYPLPHVCKMIAWLLLILWCLFCCLCIVIYGSWFDYDWSMSVNGDDSDDSIRRRLQINSGCDWDSNVTDRITQDIVFYVDEALADTTFTGNEDEDTETLIDLNIYDNADPIGSAREWLDYSERDDVYGTDLTNSDKWLYTNLISIVLGFLVWQVLWLYLVSAVYTTWPKISVISGTKRICPCCFNWFAKLDAKEEKRKYDVTRAYLISINRHLALLTMEKGPGSLKRENSQSQSQSGGGRVHASLKMRSIEIDDFEVAEKKREFESDDENSKSSKREVSTSQPKRLSGIQPTPLLHAMVEMQIRNNQISGDSSKSQQHHQQQENGGNRGGRRGVVSLPKNVNVKKEEEKENEKKDGDMVQHKNKKKRMSLNDKWRKHTKGENGRESKTTPFDSKKIDYKSFLIDDSIGVDFGVLNHHLGNRNGNEENDDEKYDGSDGSSKKESTNTATANDGESQL